MCACGAQGEMRRVATIITHHYVTLVTSVCSGMSR
nr:MAG TPA: hypothetical protein [Caudoviricetes sp.]